MLFVLEHELNIRIGRLLMQLVTRLCNDNVHQGRFPRMIVSKSWVCIRSFVCDEIADEAYARWRSETTPTGTADEDRRRLGSAKTTPSAEADNNELLAADTVGNLSQPTSRIPLGEINYDSIVACNEESSPSRVNPRGFPSAWVSRAR